MIGIIGRSGLIALLMTIPAASHSDVVLSAQIRRLEDMLLSGLPANGQNRFREAQSAWVTYKIAECRQRYLNYPAVTEIEECNSELDQERMKYLRLQLRWLHVLPGKVK
ncbi:lysozyme inhibitor LprI family protein [Brucella anthropi]|uniref:lysozyme inhibitor LprI family protein n=1 Tax=Brucella anthropi TaxID=529 RepID=UPI003EE3DE3B